MTGSTLGSTESGTGDIGASTKTLEQRYIELLEEKILKLEKELKEKSDASAPSTEKKAEPAPSAENKSADKVLHIYSPPNDLIPAFEPVEVEKKSRTRYIERRINSNGDTVDKEVKERGAEPEVSSKDEYAITWRRNYENAAEGKSLTRNELLIESDVLRKALAKVIKNYDYISFETNEVVISEPYESIYHNRRELAKYAETADEATKTDINILLEELEKEQETVRNDAKTLQEKGMIKFELLWTLFYPGCLVFATPIMNQPQVFMVNLVSLDKSQVTIWAYSMDYDGNEFGRLDVCFYIDSFKGTKAISSLLTYPLEWHRNKEGEDDTVELKKLLIARGRAFEKLCTAKRTEKHFKYHGPIIDEGQDVMLTDMGNMVGIEGNNGEAAGAGGSVISSLNRKLVKRERVCSMELQKPAEQEYNLTNLLIKALRELLCHDYEAFIQFGGKSIKVGSQTTTPADACSCVFCINGRQEYDGVSPTNKNPEKRHLSEKQLLLCPPRVVGFAMKTKVWIQMLVENVEPLDTDGKDNAFKKLELPPRSKNLLRDLVEQHTKLPNRLDDLVPGKGNGLIALLHGPPGVGKTLTAESVAILSGKPLYSISMSDVGMSPAIVETNLIRIFDLAVHWQAILLFDEADVFLESRSLTDLRRNGLVSGKGPHLKYSHEIKNILKLTTSNLVLLRVLEYYHGILFLTTNRVKTFDEAFQSRVHIAIKYEELQPHQRENIWNMWLDQLDEEDADITGIKANVQEELAGAQLNGRQIRNIITSAQAVARAQNRFGRLEYKHIERVTKVTTEFQHYLAHSNELARAQNLR